MIVVSLNPCAKQVYGYGCCLSFYHNVLLVDLVVHRSTKMVSGMQITLGFVVCAGIPVIDPGHKSVLSHSIFLFRPVL